MCLLQKLCGDFTGMTLLVEIHQSYVYICLENNHTFYFRESQEAHAAARITTGTKPS